MGFTINTWKVVEKGWSPDKMLLAESLMSLANGYMGQRGTFQEDYSGETQLGCYLGGVWFPDKVNKTGGTWYKVGHPDYVGRGVNTVNLLGIRITLDGIPLDLNMLTVWEFRREVDMKTGVLRRFVQADMAKGTLTIQAERFVSRTTKELLAIHYTVTPSFECEMTVEPYLDGDVRNRYANSSDTFWDLLESTNGIEEGTVLTRTAYNTVGAPRFTVGAAFVSRVEGLKFHHSESRKGWSTAIYKGNVEAGKNVVISKFSTVYTSRDHEAAVLQSLALQTAREAAKRGWKELLLEQEMAWNEVWRYADVTVQGDIGAQQGIRFSLFQLLSTYTGSDERLNIAPKGYTGERYGGATYWDTEIYCLPLYLALSGPETAKKLLLYRYRQLPQAKANAERMKMPGALYPMVTFDGKEGCDEWEIALEEIHRNAMIAFAIYNYTCYTGDTDYLYHEGFEVVAEICRYWMGRAHKDRNGRWMIHGVTGPDEFDCNVDNNWYTNRMAAWTLEWFCHVAEEVGPERCQQIGCTEEELARMKQASETMYLPVDAETGLFEQHDGYMNKDLRPASLIPRADKPILKHWSWDRIARSCYIKQPDVLLGLWLLGDLYDDETIRRHFDFYEPMTVHESSLSPSVHAILASRIGYRDKAIEMYRRNARADLDNIYGDTVDGLHVTGMPGSWLAITQGFAGMRTHHGLSFNPFLPDIWEGYSFMIRYRERSLKVSVVPGTATVELVSGDPVKVTLCGETVLLESMVSASIE